MSDKWRLAVRGEFSASHAIENYGGKCEEMHGHNFGVEAVVEGDALDEATGMLLDFTVLKRELNGVLDTLDHSHLNDNPALAGASPSSETIARYVHLELKKRLLDHPVRLASVTVSEKAAQSATYFED